MKNLIDELHGLNNDEYKVSEDFSKRVMKKIRKDKNRNKLNYVISLASVGVVACLAVVLFHNSSLKSNVFNFNKNKAESANLMKQSTSVYNLTEEEASMENDKAYRDLENSDIETDKNDMYSTLNMANKELEKETSLGDNSYITEDKLNTSASPESLLPNQTKSLQVEIEKLLKQAGFIVESLENELKVKATKEEVENILKEYQGTIVEVQGEYIIIKF